jgi:hypothetical protein
MVNKRIPKIFNLQPQKRFAKFFPKKMYGFERQSAVKSLTKSNASAQTAAFDGDFGRLGFKR